MSLTSYVCLDDFENAAKRKLPKQTLDYYASGADDEITLTRNHSFGRSLIIRPRFLTDVSKRDMSVTINCTGYKSPFPIGVAPTASQCLAHPDGELATSRAASALGCIHICSTIATKSLEDISSAANGQGERWFQLYITKDRQLTTSFVRRAESAGFKALVVTVDTPLAGKRRLDQLNGFSLPPHLRMANFAGHGDSDRKMVAPAGKSGFGEFMKTLMDQSLKWSDVDWLIGISRLPVILKGLLTAEDVELAIKHKVAGVIVSNHGGRQLDTGPSALEALIEIKKRVGNRIELFVDGGFRTGTDVLKAVACGAKAVPIPRSTDTVGGEEGVNKVLDIAASEFDLAMALSGCRNVADIKDDMVVTEDYYKQAVCRTACRCGASKL